LLDKLVNATPITGVYGRYILEEVHGKLTDITIGILSILGKSQCICNIAI
jgi:hypothetical protein